MTQMATYQLHEFDHQAQTVGLSFGDDMVTDDPRDFTVPWNVRAEDGEFDTIEIEANEDLDIVLPDGTIVATWVEVQAR